MKTQHTPGPWRIGDAGGTVFGPPTGKPSPEIIASVTVTRAAFPSERAKANARLIAAAPDLLAALSGLLDEGMSKTDQPESDAEVLAFWRDQARAAIAKATGK